MQIVCSCVPNLFNLYYSSTIRVWHFVLMRYLFSKTDSSDFNLNISKLLTKNTKCLPSVIFSLLEYLFLVPSIPWTIHPSHFFPVFKTSQVLYSHLKWPNQFNNYITPQKSLLIPKSG